MPTLDFALICDHVRAEAEGGVVHVIGGGFDTIHSPEVPTGRNIGLGARILLARNECGREHRFELFVQDEDGEHVTQISGPFSGEWPEENPASWSVGVGLALNIGVPLPRYGLYSLELLVNDSLVKSIPFRLIPVNGG